MAAAVVVADQARQQSWMEADNSPYSDLKRILKDWVLEHRRYWWVASLDIRFVGNAPQLVMAQA